MKQKEKNMKALFSKCCKADLVWSAAAMWDADLGEMVLTNVFDDPPVCDNCGNESEALEAEID